MLRRWLGARASRGARGGGAEEDDVVVTTDDPLAAIDPSRQIYSVSRSVVLPRVALRSCNAPVPGTATSASGSPGSGAAPGGAGGAGSGGGVNPIFADHLDCTTLPHKPTQQKHPPGSVHPAHQINTPIKPSAVPLVSSPATKPASSGYGSHGGSSHDPTYLDAVAVLEQNASFVKSILVAVKNNKSRRSVGSLGSSAAGTLTLTTIPEGKVDFSIPRPVWPKRETKKPAENFYDSLVDESLLLYTSLSYVPDNNEGLDKDKQLSANDILKELSETINSAVEGKTGMSPEQILKCISDRLSTSLDVLQRSTEEDMRKLSVNLSNSEHLNTVIRAFSNSSSSGLSSQTSDKCSAMDAEDIYQVPSGCSSSGFSGGSSGVSRGRRLPVFVHEDLSSVPNGVRNALIYGTLCRAGNTAAAAGACTGNTPRSGLEAASSGNAGTGGASERLLGGNTKKHDVMVTSTPIPARNLLTAPPDEKPSVWEIYYGAGVVDGDTQLKTKPTDTPYFPAGRPEADFTLDVSRSEMLTRRMRAAKKWRFRCRLVTSFLGLVFFLLSLMAVSLMLTRGKRMFGSMV